VQESYKSRIARLYEALPYSCEPEPKSVNRIPSSATSEFLTNKAQGDWAEEVVLKAVNQYSRDFVAVQYGRSDSISAGEEGFAEFYSGYLDELASVGKKPDLLIYRREQLPDTVMLERDDPDTVSRAVAAIEVRSSSFLANRYWDYMRRRTSRAMDECGRIRDQLLEEPFSSLLSQKNPELLKLLQVSGVEAFRDLDFAFRRMSSSADLIALSELLHELKKQIKILQRRDHLSITPKLEDLAGVNRWIQRFGVPHFYLQVFFDKAYLVSFQRILEISADSSLEGNVFSVESDIKNQGKTTIKIDIGVGSEVIGRIDMPEHSSVMKELDRGRLLFHVIFSGGQGYLDESLFCREIEPVD